MSREEMQLEEQVRMGSEVMSFLQSPIGKFLTERAAEEVDVAVEDLKRANPEDAKEIRRLQSIIDRNENFGRWLQELLHAALEARAILANEEP